MLIGRDGVVFKEIHQFQQSSLENG